MIGRTSLTLAADSDAGIVKDFSIISSKGLRRAWLACGDGNLYYYDLLLSSKGKIDVSKKL